MEKKIAWRQVHKPMSSVVALIIPTPGLNWRLRWPKQAYKCHDMEQAASTALPLSSGNAEAWDNPPYISNREDLKC